MIGLDTNVLVRYIVQDDPAQSTRATRLIERECRPEDPGFINGIVLCEVVWVLRRAYRLEKTVVAAVVRRMLSAAELRVEHADVAWRALRLYAEGKCAFSDGMIALLNRSQHVDRTYTFDRQAARCDGFALIE